MKIAKTNIYRDRKIQIEDPELKNQLRRNDQDMSNLFLAMQGRIRFGTGIDGDRGENISGEFQTYTSNATPDTEDTLAHTLGATPVGFIVLHQDKAGSVYQGPTTGTNWTSNNIYLKCDVASVTFLLFLIK